MPAAPISCRLVSPELAPAPFALHVSQKALQEEIAEMRWPIAEVKAKSREVRERILALRSKHRLSELLPRLPVGSCLTHDLEGYTIARIRPPS